MMTTMMLTILTCNLRQNRLNISFAHNLFCSPNGNEHSDERAFQQMVFIEILLPGHDDSRTSGCCEFCRNILKEVYDSLIIIFIGRP